MKAICQLCNEVYAIVGLFGDVGRPPLRYPLTGAMFSSPDERHGMPAPFDPSLTWEFFRCPYGRIHRPMVQDDAVLTDEGMVRLPKDGSPAYLTTETGEVDRHSIGDRVLQVSDEEAEKQVRAHVKAAEGQVSKVLMDAMLTHDEEQARAIGGTPAILGMEKGLIVNVPVAGTDFTTPVFIQDETPAITDEAAEKVARLTLVPPLVGEPIHVDTVLYDGKELPTVELVYTCPTCGKEFPTEKQMKGHIGGAHKQGKKKGRK